jgi:uncharacterized membrane protein YhaH (DUF805 family)
MKGTLPFVLALVATPTPVGVDAGKWYLLVLRKYAVFSGRSQRMEFWMFALVHSVVLIGLGLIEGWLLGSGSDDQRLASIYNLGVVIPAIAVGVRRLHDTDHSGWWTIVPFVNFYFCCIDGTSGDNRFGPDPKGVARGPTKANLTPDSPIDRSSLPPVDVAGEVADAVNRAFLQREALEAALEVDRKAVYGPLDDIYQTGWASKAASAGEAVVDCAGADARKLMRFLKKNDLGRALTGGAVRSRADKYLLVDTAKLLSAKIDEGLNPSLAGMQALRQSLRTIANKSGASDAAQDAFETVDDIMRRMFPELEEADNVLMRSSQRLDAHNIGMGFSKSISFREPDLGDLSLDGDIDAVRELDLGDLSLDGSVDGVRDAMDNIRAVVKDTGGDLAQQDEVVNQFLDGVFHRTIIAPLQTTKRAAVIEQLQEMMDAGGSRVWLRIFFSRAADPKAAFERFERELAQDIPGAIKSMEGMR